ncbi:MAG TPA: hypothetical protein VHX88_03245 [Solirubrobacteraceae bacterium]|nr:hypothetical protein [Solirubrobacteraceae bacterium]
MARRWAPVPLLLLGLLAGCGGSGPTARSTVTLPVHISSTPPPSLPARATAPASRPALTPTPTHAHPITPPKVSQATIAKVDVDSDAVVAAADTAVGSANVSPDAPSDSEIRKEVQEAAAAGITLPQTGNTASSFEQAVANESVTLQQAVAAGASIPGVSWNPLRKPIADWIIPVLHWAAAHGWSGYVTSGYRTFVQQAALNDAGDFSAPAGYSNHETTKYPGGAVDVTQPAQLLGVLAGQPGPLKLIGGKLGPADPEHFSATGF